MATLTSAITANARLIGVTDGPTDQRVGSYLLIDDEVVSFEGYHVETARWPYTTDTTRWRITRGLEGTAKAAHSQGATLTETSLADAGGAIPISDGETTVQATSITTTGASVSEGDPGEAIVGNVAVLPDPGTVWVAATAVEVGDRAKRTFDGEVIVYEVTQAGTTVAQTTAFPNPPGPWDESGDGEGVIWHFVGIVGKVPVALLSRRTSYGTLDENLDIRRVASVVGAGDADARSFANAATGSAEASSQATTSTGNAFANSQATTSTGNAHVNSFSHTGAGDTTANNRATTGDGTATSEIRAVNNQFGEIAVRLEATNSSKALILEGLPSVDPEVAGALFTSGAPGPADPKALMVSGGPAA